MKNYRKLLSLLLTLSMVLVLFSACADQPKTAVENTAQTTAAATADNSKTDTSVSGYYQPGDKIQDFTVTTYDGTTVSLYQVLEEKKMVLLNFWATWCGPCAMEFPAMQAAYELYRDKIEILALSVEPTDTPDVLSSYAAERGLTFPMAQDAAGISYRFQTTGIPTSVVVDRFGTICLIETGAQIDADVFCNLFEVFSSEDYQESFLLSSMKAQKPTAEPASGEALGEALNAQNGTLTFRNSANPYIWPMTVSQEDGRSVVVSTNTAVRSSEAMVQTVVDVKAGDAVVISFKLRCESAYEKMVLSVDGQPVKTFSGSRDWITYAHAFSADAQHTVSVSFQKNANSASKESCLWLDSIALVSGDEAAAALNRNPVYPVSEETSMEILNEDVKMLAVFNPAQPDLKDTAYLIPEDTLKLAVTLDKSVDPEAAYIEDSSYQTHSFVANMQSDGYHFSFPLSQDVPFNGVYLYAPDYLSSIAVFTSEEQIQTYLDLVRAYNNVTLEWEYIATTAPVSGDVTYTIRYVDQDGNPVAGVMCQVCDDSICQVYVSDENGICSFTLPAFAYEIHTLKLPEGYEGDTTTVTLAPAQGGELTFTLQKS